jgi:4-hydroxy-3-methylbut-2-enyl diphosphate reductase
MKVEKARELGFCFGVRRALRMIEDAAGRGQEIATLGPIVHNRTVVARLKALGVTVADSVEGLTGKVIAVSSHGVPPDVLEKIRQHDARFIDTTCPIVRSAQKAAHRLAASGYGVVIFGEASHPEVRGLLGWAGPAAVASMDAGVVLLDGLPRRVGILAQTTQNRGEFVGFVNGLNLRMLPWMQELRVINTLCQETQKRQLAAVELAGESDLMIVVGGHNSANTRHLAEVCMPIVETHHIESADELDSRWLAGKESVGITAGASTPDEAIEQVMLRIRGAA